MYSHVATLEIIILFTFPCENSRDLKTRNKKEEALDTEIISHRFAEYYIVL